MSHRKKGRRIFTRKAKNHRIFSVYHPLRTAAGTVLTLVLAAVLGFVGYHVIGPIVTRIRAEEQNPTKTPEPFFSEVAEVSGSDPLPAETTTTTSFTVTTTTSATVSTTETTTTAVQISRFGEDVTVAYLADADALTDLDSVEAEAQRLFAEGYRAMVLPMKETGGMLNYASANEKALGSGASNADLLTVREIRNAASRYNIRCIAMMSTLEDQVYPNTYLDGSYTFKEGSTRWLDNKADNGGKPWLSPFTDAAGAYLASLAEELSDGGFSPIICTDTRFPNFFDSDVERLGKKIQDKERRQNALTDLLNGITKAAPEVCCMIDLHEAVSGNEEAFVPDKLDMEAVCIRIDIRDFTEPFKANGKRFDPTSLEFTDKVSMLARAADAAADGKTVYPCIVSEGLTDSELETVVSLFRESGHELILVTPD
ncbi:MAG: hypothetical protein IJ060_01700 [Oscillospiraceae bacterium]|nr:hypothetical protein [Oscillospiraceae bacterium]